MEAGRGRAEEVYLPGAGLEAHAAARSGGILRQSSWVLQDGSVDPASRELFHSHDVCHVVFGLDMTLMDEALADAGPSWERTQAGCVTLAITITGLPKITRALWRSRQWGKNGRGKNTGTI
jgi:hypothetical protein